MTVHLLWALAYGLLAWVLPRMQPRWGRLLVVLVALGHTLHLSLLLASTDDYPFTWVLAALAPMASLAWVSVVYGYSDAVLLRRLFVLAALLALLPQLPVLGSADYPLSAAGTGYYWHGYVAAAGYGVMLLGLLQVIRVGEIDTALHQGQQLPLGMSLLAAEQLLSRLLLSAFVLVSAVLLSGLWLRRQDLQPLWRWDHKTVLSLASWLVLAVVLVGRHYFGWRGRMLLRLSWAGLLLLLLAYGGTRFVLEVVLQRG